MSSSSKTVFQVKVSLRIIRPPIWRRLLLPTDATFWDLHVAIQDSMGWGGGHLHEFSAFNPRQKRMETIGIPLEQGHPNVRVLPEWEVPVRRMLTLTHRKASYLYDFGDNWQHTLLLEKVLPRDPNVIYPQCIAGRRKCPPDDCGGIPGYEEFVGIMSNPADPQHNEMRDWFGGPYQPEEFDASAVVFEAPEPLLAEFLEAFK